MQINTATTTIVIATTAESLLKEGLDTMAYAEASEEAYCYQFNVLVDDMKVAATSITVIITAEYGVVFTMKIAGED